MLKAACRENSDETVKNDSGSIFGAFRGFPQDEVKEPLLINEAKTDDSAPHITPELLANVSGIHEPCDLWRRHWFHGPLKDRFLVQPSLSPSSRA